MVDWLTNDYRPLTAIDGEKVLIVLLSGVFWGGLYMFHDLVYKALPGRKAFAALLTEEDKVEWRSRVISNVHAAVTSAVCVYSLTQEDWGDAFLAHPPVATIAMLVSCGYLIYDALLVVLHHKQLGGGGSTLAHHISGIFSVAISHSYGAGSVCIIAYFGTELTTPCVNNRWFFEKSGMKSSNAYKFNGLAMWFGFLLIRVSIAPCLGFYLYTHRDQMMAVPVLLSAFTLLLFFVINSLNLYWFFLITRGMLRHVFPKAAKGERPAKVAKEHKSAAPPGRAAPRGSQESGSDTPAKAAPKAKASHKD
eukprot:tig00021070_g17820.t1